MVIRKKSDTENTNLKKSNLNIKNSDEKNIGTIEDRAIEKAKASLNVNDNDSIIKKGIKQGVNSYRKELEKEDDAVKVINTLIDTSHKALKQTKKIKNKTHQLITQYKENQNETAVTIETKLKEKDYKIKKQFKEKSKYSDTSDTKDTKLKEKDFQKKESLKKKHGKLDKQKNTEVTKQKNKQKNFIKKQIFTLSTKAVDKYAEQLQDDPGTESAIKSIKLSKEGITQLKNTTSKLKNSKTLNIAKNKISKKQTISNLRKDVNVKVIKIDNQKLRKKQIRRQQIELQRKKWSKKVSNGFSSLFTKLSNNTKNFTNVVKNTVGTKIAAIFGGGLSTLLPILGVIGIIIILFAIFTIGGQHQQQIEGNIGAAQNLSPEVERWRELVTKIATEEGLENYVDLILAIIQVESGGTGTRDIMQSSESAGYPPNYFQNEEDSIRQGVKHLKNIIKILQSYGKGYENNAKLIAQSYNFGSNFAWYVGSLGGTYDLSIAEAYSRDVVAPSLGNTTGATHSYVNAVSKSFGKPYLYINGGNFFYGELVAQYLKPISVVVTDGDFKTVIQELEKYIGYPYKFGGKSPNTSFDCSGLVEWGYRQIGIKLPSPARNQYALTQKIDPKDAKPGDLIFFKGTYGASNFISHVGIYIDEDTMFDANGSGIGYHNWRNKYWQSHFDSIRRIAR